MKIMDKTENQMDDVRSKWPHSIQKGVTILFENTNECDCQTGSIDADNQIRYCQY